MPSLFLPLRYSTLRKSVKIKCCRPGNCAYVQRFSTRYSIFFGSKDNRLFVFRGFQCLLIMYYRWRYFWMPIRLVRINVDPIHFDPIHFVYEISLVLQSVVQLPNILGNACQKQRYVQYKTASKQKKWPGTRILSHKLLFYTIVLYGRNIKF